MLADFLHVITFQKDRCLKFGVGVPFGCWTLCLEGRGVFQLGFQLFKFFQNVSVRFVDVTALVFECCLEVVFEQLGDIFDNWLNLAELLTGCLRFDLTVKTGPKWLKGRFEVGMAEKLLDKLVGYVHLIGRKYLLKLSLQLQNKLYINILICLLVPQFSILTSPFWHIIKCCSFDPFITSFYRIITLLNHEIHLTIPGYCGSKSNVLLICFHLLNSFLSTRSPSMKPFIRLCILSCILSLCLLASADTIQSEGFEELTREEMIQMRRSNFFKRILQES